ncbi:MAG TPA: asparaginase, partial [Roseiarcus sp.]|nr:asparaginase [Roseiarcus sp.]
FALGDVEAAVFPRSAVKALQALPLIESGAADKYKLTDAEIALACSSHSGEPIHLETARAMLAKCGLDGSALECGAHWPLDAAASRALAASGAAPSALHNNCSGKHAGFLCLACAAGRATKGYVKYDHDAQRQVRAALGEMTKLDLGAAPWGIDGCAVPTYAMPLRALALAFARFGAGEGLDADRAAAARRIRAACAAHPHLVAGTGRFDTLIMIALGARAFVKTGAEGVYCGALPELGLGVAIKCDDGAGRAAEVAMAAIIARFLPLDDNQRALLAPRLSSVLYNWNGASVGTLRASQTLSA